MEPNTRIVPQNVAQGNSRARRALPPVNLADILLQGAELVTEVRACLRSSQVELHTANRRTRLTLPSPDGRAVSLQLFFPTASDAFAGDLRLESTRRILERQRRRQRLERRRTRRRLGGATAPQLPPGPAANWGGVRTGKPRCSFTCEEEKRQQFAALVDPKRRALERMAVYRTGGNHDATEDLLQDSLLVAYREFEHFVPGRSFLDWVYAIMRNTQAGKYRRKERRRRLMATESLGAGSEGSEGEMRSRIEYDLALSPGLTVCGRSPVVKAHDSWVLGSGVAGIPRIVG